MTVLIVDDDHVIRELLVEAFSDEGYATATAEDGKEVLAYLEAAPELPRLILLDIMMPVMNGAQCWRALKANASWTTIPIMFLSAGIYLQRAGRALPVVAMITKPIDLPQLLSLARPYCTPAATHAVGE
jgi:two-component system, chemotaxis family, chemotaxis protein CheY